MVRLAQKTNRAPRGIRTMSTPKPQYGNDPPSPFVPSAAAPVYPAPASIRVLFCVVLLLVIAITNIPLRGLWSVIVIVVIVSLTIIFALLEWWEKILSYLPFLDIRVNAAGYFVISIVLLILWLVVMLLFDQ